MKNYRLLVIAIFAIGSCKDPDTHVLARLRNLSNGMPEVRVYYEWDDYQVGDTIRESTFSGPVYYRVESFQRSTR